MRTILGVTAVLACFSGCNEYGTFTDTREEDMAERFEVTGVKSDVIFFSDTSGSMERERIKLANNVVDFIDRLDDSARDWQLIAVTGPSGCGNRGIITPETPDLAATFKAAINEKPGEDNVDEWGLFNVFKAVLASSPGGCNEGLIRPDSQLHVIFMSDEADSSPGAQLGGDYWKDYVDPVLYMKDNPAQVRFSAIGGPVPNGCSGAEAGYGYSDAVSATGGEFLSICDDWEAQVGLLADKSVSQSFFPMQWPPLLVDEIRVEVNQIERDAGWIYDVENQGIQFDIEVPSAYDVVDVYYRAIVEFETDEKPAE